MGNSVKSPSQVRDTTYRGSRKYDTTTFLDEMVVKQNEKASINKTGGRDKAKDINNVGETLSRGNSKLPLQFEIKSPGKRSADDDNDAISSRRDSFVDSKTDTHNPKQEPLSRSVDVQVIQHYSTFESKQLPIAKSDSINKNLSKSSRSLPNASTRDKTSQQSKYTRNRAKSDPVQTRKDYILKGPELSIVHEDEIIEDKNKIKKESRKSLKETKNTQKHFKSVSDAHIRPGAKFVSDSRSKKRTQSEPVKIKAVPDFNKATEQDEKPLKPTDLAQQPQQKIKEISKKSTQSLPNNHTAKMKDAEYGKRRAQSDPIIHTTSNVLKEPYLEILREEGTENEDRVVSRESGQVLLPELSEGSIDIEGRYLEISSSLRSTALDSRLFGSESSIVTHTSPELPKPESRFSDNKQNLKASLIEMYQFYNVGKAALSVLPEENTTSSAYFPPWMTVTRRVKTEEDLEEFGEHTDMDYVDMENYEMEVKVNKIHEIFHHEGREMKNVFIVGESGTGKTAFCQHLIQQWCRQHQQEVSHDDMNEHTIEAKDNVRELNQLLANSRNSREDRNILQFETRPDQNKVSENTSNSEHIAQTFDDISELAKFDFLFYLPLFHITQHEHIHDMIKTQYKNIMNRLTLDQNAQGTRSNPMEQSVFLNDLLDKDSEKVLILLDGLDQWRPSKKRYKTHIPTAMIPKQDPSKRYTILVTSTIKPRDVETRKPELEISLYGIEEGTSYKMVNNAVDRLNIHFGRKKKASDMISELNRSKARHYQHFPYTLESLVCLWYHGGQIGNTLCDVFSRVLELLLKRYNDLESSTSSKGRKTLDRNSSTQINGIEKNVQLPRYFIKLVNCNQRKVLVYLLAKNAWATRKQKIKAFDFSEFEMYGYSQTDIHNLMKVGILTQQKYPGYSELEHRKKAFFTDEHLQNFLATTYIALLCRNETYENIGNIEVHTRNISTVVGTHLDVFNTYEQILEFSDMSVMLCGLFPPTIEQVTQTIYDTVSKDKRILDYRANLEYECEDNASLEIQELIFDCAQESLSVNTDAITLHIGDLFFGEMETMRLKYIVPEEVASLSINTNQTHGHSQEIKRTSDFIYQSRIFNKLQKLLIKDEGSHLTIQDIESLHVLSQRCAQHLKIVAYIFNIAGRIMYQSITFNLDMLLPQMQLLAELELGHIKLNHVKFGRLSSVLSDMICLRKLKLTDITCEMQRCDGEEHKMDFLEYKNLEYIDLDGRELPVIGVNKTHIVTCVFGNLPQGPEIQTFFSLRKAEHLKHFTQKVRKRPSFISQTLIATLNSWHSLENLHLEGVNFAENELVFNKGLQYLSHIRLVETSMNRVVWRLFVDSLTSFGQEITVVTRDIHILPISGEFTRDSLRRPIDAETRAILLANETERHQAFEYVRGKSMFFSVVFDMKNMFDFVKR